MGGEIGAEVWLEKAPLKYEGLSYTEIWISEAQERMVLAVPAKSWDRLAELCRGEGVEATIIGRFEPTGRLVLKYEGKQVGDLDMKFLHDGRPDVVREAVYSPPSFNSEPTATASSTSRSTSSNFTPMLLSLLGSLNIASKETIIRQYDHEVQGGAVIRPLVGVCNDGPSDAAVVRPVLGSQRGIVVACGMNPKLGNYDPYWMAAAAIDEAVRNCVAVGADPRRIALLDNFCWGRTDKPETLGALVRAALGCHDAAVALGLPFISGKDSLHNEFSYVDAAGNRQTIAIPHSLLISAMGQVADVRTCVTMDLKRAGNLLYQIGETRDELAGSHYAEEAGIEAGSPPRVWFAEARRIFAALHEAILAGLVAACHDLSEGGLAVAAAEMAFAGGLGARLYLSECPFVAGIDGPHDPTDILLFAESNSRFLCEVPAEKRREFEEALAGVPHACIGEVTGSGRLEIIGLPTGSLIHAAAASAPAVVSAGLEELKSAWQAALVW
jgi:phosphoribosylformylglycinamidine (FGAM) synthase-like enzyme